MMNFRFISEKWPYLLLFPYLYSTLFILENGWNQKHLMNFMNGENY